MVSLAEGVVVPIPMSVPGVKRAASVPPTVQASELEAGENSPVLVLPENEKAGSEAEPRLEDKK